MAAAPESEPVGVVEAASVVVVPAPVVAAVPEVEVVAPVPDVVVVVVVFLSSVYLAIALSKSPVSL